jgi:hypothetical protein
MLSTTVAIISLLLEYFRFLVLYLSTFAIFELNNALARLH